MAHPTQSSLLINQRINKRLTLRRPKPGNKIVGDGAAIKPTCPAGHVMKIRLIRARARKRVDGGIDKPDIRFAGRFSLLVGQRDNARPHRRGEAGAAHAAAA